MNPTCGNECGSCKGETFDPDTFAELDSPNFTPKEATALAERGFERRNRRSATPSEREREKP
jgi:hypothetical protein